MISMTLKQFKEGFFTPELIESAADKATVRNLSKFGAFVRTTARRSVRKRKGISVAGKPPHSHTGDLRSGILFAYDANARSVVAGPFKFNRPSNLGALEYGGVTTNAKGNDVDIAARPFMTPAFEAEKAKLPDIWANSIRK